MNFKIFFEFICTTLALKCITFVYSLSIYIYYRFLLSSFILKVDLVSLSCLGVHIHLSKSFKTLDQTFFNNGFALKFLTKLKIN